MAGKHLNETTASAPPPAETQRLARAVLKAVQTQAISDRNISFKGRTTDEIKKEIRRFLQAITTGAISVVPIIDHREHLLREARAFLRQTKWDCAILLYATYFEHVVNSLLSVEARRRRLAKGSFTQMIREVNFPGKTGWLLEALGMKPLNSLHRQRLIKLSEIRNAFVHYKWQPKVDSEVDSAGQFLKDVEKTVKYLRRYEERMCYDGQRRHLARIGKRSP